MMCLSFDAMSGLHHFRIGMGDPLENSTFQEARIVIRMTSEDKAGCWDVG